jgi:hypothetical protein
MVEEIKDLISKNFSANKKQFEFTSPSQKNVV